MRIIFFAGKGGVGKTSMSAATGIRAAESGKRTVILSLDTAHSLSDIFDLKKNLMDQNRGEPVKVAENLWIQELDIQAEIARNWGRIYDYISTVLVATGQEEMQAEELAILPGMEELSLLLHINRYVRENTYDVLILDSAPTGEAVRFISIPATLEWYMNKFFKIERKMAKYVGPLVEKMYKVPMPKDEVYAAIDEIFGQLKGVDQVLMDPEITTVRLVCNPEKIVLAETQRAFMYFGLYKMHVDAIVMNRVLPAGVKDSYFSDWRKNQKAYIKKARELFDPVPILGSDLFRTEVLGYDRLKKLGGQVYGKKDPLKRFFKGKPYELVKEDGTYRLTIRLPFVEKSDVKVSRSPDELIVRLGSVKRNILLPRHVAAAQNVSAKISGQNLNVLFS